MTHMDESEAIIQEVCNAGFALMPILILIKGNEVTMSIVSKRCKDEDGRKAMVWAPLPHLYTHDVNQSWHQAFLMLFRIFCSGWNLVIELCVTIKSE